MAGRRVRLLALLHRLSAAYGRAFEPMRGDAVEALHRQAPCAFPPIGTFAGKKIAA